MNEIFCFKKDLKYSKISHYPLHRACTGLFIALFFFSNTLSAGDWEEEGQDFLDQEAPQPITNAPLNSPSWNPDWEEGNDDEDARGYGRRYADYEEDLYPHTWTERAVLASYEQQNSDDQAMTDQDNLLDCACDWECRWTDFWGPVSPVSYGETGYCDCNPADGYGFCDPHDPYGRLQRYGIWMPECPVLFKPLMADPRQVCYSVGWRFDDWVFVKNVIDVSYADSFAIYRWCNLFFWQDALQIDLEGGLWAIFDPLHESSPLINADYYVGVPLTYRLGPFSGRLRFYHISSHIGDEFLLNHPLFCRLNPSAEYLDLCLSYQITPQLRVYAGAGVILQRDISFPFKRTYLEWGAESYFPFWQFYSIKDSISGAPFFAMHFRSREDNHFRHDATYVLGYELAKHSGLCRKLRFFLEYHQGFSVEGQFSRFKTNYLALRASYGF